MGTPLEPWGLLLGVHSVDPGSHFVDTGVQVWDPAVVRYTSRTLWYTLLSWGTPLKPNGTFILYRLVKDSTNKSLFLQKEKSMSI